MEGDKITDSGAVLYGKKYRKLNLADDGSVTDETGKLCAKVVNDYQTVYWEDDDGQDGATTSSCQKVEAEPGYDGLLAVQLNDNGKTVKAVMIRCG